MAYELHIKRSPRSPELTLEEWGEAIDGIKILRFNSDPVLARNPRTGAEVKVPGTPGDVEMYFEDEKEWIKIFHWADGSISFDAQDVPAQVWRIVVELA